MGVAGGWLIYWAASAAVPVLGWTERPVAGEEKYDTLAVVENGAVRALENGDRVTLADGVEAAVFLSPFPPQRRTDLYLYLIQSGEDAYTGKPDVEAEYFMTQMDCEWDTRSGLELQRGRYVLPLNFTMRGEWAIDLRVGWTEKTARLRLVTNVR